MDIFKKWTGLNAGQINCNNKGLLQSTLPGERAQDDDELVSDHLPLSLGINVLTIFYLGTHKILSKNFFKKSHFHSDCCAFIVFQFSQGT